MIHLHLLMPASLQACKNACMYARWCEYTSMQACMHACMYACLYQGRKTFVCSSSPSLYIEANCSRLPGDLEVVWEKAFVWEES